MTTVDLILMAATFFGLAAALWFVVFARRIGRQYEAQVAPPSAQEVAQDHNFIVTTGESNTLFEAMRSVALGSGAVKVGDVKQHKLSRPVSKSAKRAIQKT